MTNQGCIHQRCTHLRAQLARLPQGHFLCPNQYLHPPTAYSQTLVRAGEIIGTSIPCTSWRDNITTRRTSPDCSSREVSLLGRSKRRGREWFFVMGLTRPKASLGRSQCVPLTQTTCSASSSVPLR